MTDQTIGEYIRTREAIRAAEKRREDWLKGMKPSGGELLAMRRGPPGTLDYGRTVFLMKFPGISPDRPLFEVAHIDFSLLSHYREPHFRMYRRKSAAEKRFRGPGWL